MNFGCVWNTHSSHTGPSMHYPREDVPDCSSLVKKITSLSSMLGALSVQGVEMRKSFHPTETDLQECFHHPSICFCSPGLEQHQSWERSGVRKEQASLLPSTSTLRSWLADPIQVRQSEDLGLVFKGKRITRSSIRSATVLEILTVLSSPYGNDRGVLFGGTPLGSPNVLFMARQSHLFWAWKHHSLAPVAFHLIATTMCCCDQLWILPVAVLSPALVAFGTRWRGTCIGQNFQHSLSGQ